MAKSNKKQNRTAKPKTNLRSAQSREERQSAFGDPTDQFVTDAELEAREADRRASKSRSTGRKRSR